MVVVGDKVVAEAELMLAAVEISVLNLGKMVPGVEFVGVEVDIV